MGSYGTGADGAVTISSNTQLSSDMNYTTLVIDNGVTLDVNDKIIRCSVSFHNNGTVKSTVAYASAGGAGGTGGSGGDCSSVEHTDLYAYGGAGGTGGSGGTGGGRIRIYAPSFDNEHGTITANGGNGGNGNNGGDGGYVGQEGKWTNDISGGGGGGGGGGNGGNGGTVEVKYSTKTEGTVTVSGGSGGSGGIGGSVTNTGFGCANGAYVAVSATSGGTRAGAGGTASYFVPETWTAYPAVAGSNGTSGSSGSSGSTTWTFEATFTSQIFIF